MCGILATLFEHELPDALRARGRDGEAHREAFGVHVSHCLHATVGDVAQPLVGTGVLAANCELYNWRELAAANDVDARNDAELLFRLLEQLPDEAFSTGELGGSMIDARLSGLLAELSGSYAFVYARESFLVALRDPFGIRPIVFAEDAIASSHSALAAVDRRGRELHPRRMLRFDLPSGRASFAQLPVSFPRDPRSFSEAFEAAVVERLPESGPAYVMLSGGVDSSLIASIAAEHAETIGVSVSVRGSRSSDREAARLVARELGIELVEVDVDPAEVPEQALSLARAIGEPHALKVSAALPTLFAARAVAERGGKLVLSGAGADEVFGAHARDRENANALAESWAQLLALWESNALAQDSASMASTIEVRYPFLDREVVAASWRSLEPSDETKPALRAQLRARGLDRVAGRPRKAAQYGTGLDDVLARHARSLRMSKSRFLARAAQGKPIAALVSGGKDSLYALFLLVRFNYVPRCAISVVSDDPDSFMYHTPTARLIPEVARRLGLVVVLERTRGERERELDALRSALRRAIAEHGIVGVSSGAIKSNYQRDRLLLLCEEAGLSLHSPLWQTDPLAYARSLDARGFVVVVTRVAAEGLSDSDVGRRFSLGWAEKLAGRGISPVGEGGEFETLVVDCPLYEDPLPVRLVALHRDGLNVTGEFALAAPSEALPTGRSP